MAEKMMTWDEALAWAKETGGMFYSPDSECVFWWDGERFREPSGNFDLLDEQDGLFTKNISQFQMDKMVRAGWDLKLGGVEWTVTSKSPFSADCFRVS